MISLVDDYKLREMFFFFEENCGLNGATPIFFKTLILDLGNCESTVQDTSNFLY